MEIIEMEIVEMEKQQPWKTVNKKKKKDENQLMRRRPWDALPSLAVSYIFRNLDYKDRFGSVPFVCKALFLDPFSFSYPNNESVDHDEILHLIANCCPNLKHISFNGFYCVSIEAVLEVFQKCKKIELINFSDSRYADSEQVIVELVKSLPNLRGIRMEGWKDNNSIHDAITTHFPWIKFQNEKLPYSGIFCEECEDQTHGIRVRVHRPGLHVWGRRRLCYCCFHSEQVEEEKQLEAAEKAEYLNSGKEQYSIMKEKKRRTRYSILKEEKKRRTRKTIRSDDHQYLVLKTRMKKKNKNEASFILKMKMRKKRDICDYQDFYVHAGFL